MIRRQCPSCGENWYSCNTGPWRCGRCGEHLDYRHNKPLLEEERRKEDEVVDRIHW